MSGKFITFEGSDGAGKTTVLKSILGRLRSFFGNNLLLTREPGGYHNRVAEEIRKVILDPRNTAMTPLTETLLYAASRHQHLVKTVIPALKANKWVFCDRYVDSSIAYQGGGRQLGIDIVKRINVLATGGVMPDLTLYFNLPAKVGIQRIKQHRANKIDRLDMEKMSFYKRVHSAYDKLAQEDPGRIKVIDANCSLADVRAQVFRVLNQNLHIKL